MFNFHGADPGHVDPKTYTTIGALPGHIDPNQPPNKKPWRTINDNTFVRSLELVMPQELRAIILDQIDQQFKVLTYEKLIMKLEEVLEESFFNDFVKKDNVLMVSEGRPGVDNIFSLRRGILRLDIDKESYERAGLQGQTIRGKGRKHTKARFRIELDLRLPSMIHGKKGFERLITAARNVLNTSLTWLFLDESQPPRAVSKEDQPQSAIEKYYPTKMDCKPSIGTLQQILVPPLCPPSIGDDTALNEWIYEITEWLGLVGLESPRIREGDTPDTYLSRYSLPGNTPPAGTQLCKVRWTGLIHSEFIINLMIQLIRMSRGALPSSISPSSIWASLTVQSHQIEPIGQVDGYSIILLAQAPTVVYQADNAFPTRSSGHNERASHSHEQPHAAETSTERNSKFSVPITDSVRPGFRFYSLFEFQDNN